LNNAVRPPPICRNPVGEGAKRVTTGAVIKGAFTVPGDGSLDFEAIVKKLAGYGYEGWFVVEAEQDPVKAPPLEMAKIGHKELLRVMAAAGYTVVAA
jgi:inosose dehydratase